MSYSARISERSYHSSHLTSPHLNWPHFISTESVDICCSHGELGRFATAHDPVANPAASRRALIRMKWGHAVEMRWGKVRCAVRTLASTSDYHVNYTSNNQHSTWQQHPAVGFHTRSAQSNQPTDNIFTRLQLLVTCATAVCLSVCLFVNKIAKTDAGDFSRNLGTRLTLRQSRDDWIWRCWGYGLGLGL